MDAVDPLGFVFHAGSGTLGLLPTSLRDQVIVERLREVQRS